MPALDKVSRREILASSAAGLAAMAAGQLRGEEAKQPVPTKSIAAIITEYRPNSHADVLIGKILEGWKQDGGAGPALKLAAMYVDQFPAADLARPMSKKHKVPIFGTIEQALTLGGDRIAVDGVISIGEHGDYPWNDKGQHLYPRRRFFEGITGAFAKYKQAVPVFNDKHLGPVWNDALWMYEQSKKLEFPLMAGSSLPVTFRDPDMMVPMDSEIEAAVGIGYSGLDVYGFHALECYQACVERRRGGERGVKSVHCLQGAAMWKAVDGGALDKTVLQAALDVLPHHKDGDFREENSTIFLFDYVDGFKGALLMLPSVGGLAVALKLEGEKKLLATRFEERSEPRFPHFAYLLKAIERMMHTGEPSYPVERTLLTAGILDRALTSLAEGQKRLMTPELGIAYKPADYPHAPQPDLESR
jgi:hypothetical protein